VVFSLSDRSVYGILLDIEGTVAPIDFVYQVLFPFAREHLNAYLRANAGSEELSRDLSLLREEHRKDLAEKLGPPEWVEKPSEAQIESIQRYVFWLMDRDRKSTGLKSLQGKIWAQGYLRGELKSEMYPDVAPALARWKEKNLDVRIFSSGSVLAQKLLFAYSQYGDLTKFLRGFFDTTVGPKVSEQSYHRIAEQFHVPASQLLFISDVTAELNAAKSAGMQTLLCVRPGNPPQPNQLNHSAITNFNEILV
jgi:enolase-phosphatase E1